MLLTSCAVKRKRNHGPHAYSLRLPGSETTGVYLTGIPLYLSLKDSHFKIPGCLVL